VYYEEIFLSHLTRKERDDKKDLIYKINDVEVGIHTVRQNNEKVGPYISNQQKSQ